jgi:hypothetical protein
VKKKENELLILFLLFLNNMEKYFDLVLELLELERKENLKSIALQLEKYQKE